MFNINLFKDNDKEECLMLISNYFDLDKDEVEYELNSYKQDYNLIDFIKKFDLNLNNTYQEKVFITCRHAMTTFDNLESMKKNGLYSLKRMLQGEITLSNFIKNNHILINVDEAILNYKGMSFKILHRNDKCNKCLYTRYLCNSLLNKQPDFMNCKYRRKLNFLHTKLYHDRCETEVFINGTISDIYDYDSIRYSPEILNTIEDVISIYEGNRIDLQNKWRNIGGNRHYILEFNVSIDNLENKFTKNKYEYFGEIDVVDEEHGYDQFDFELDNISTVFYKNLSILDKLISIYIHGGYEEYGQILPETIIKGEDIKVIVEHDINYKEKF